MKRDWRPLWPYVGLGLAYTLLMVVLAWVARVYFHQSMLPLYHDAQNVPAARNHSK